MWLLGPLFGLSDSYPDIQKHQMTSLTERLCDIADDQKDKCEKISKRGHERSTVQVELEKSFANGERRAIWRSTLTYDTFKKWSNLKKWSSPSWWRIPCWGMHGRQFLKVFYKIGVVVTVLLFHHILNVLLCPELLCSFVITLSSFRVSSSTIKIIVFLL